MSSMIEYLKKKHETQECVHRYHRHKEWVLFVSLVSIILFLMIWSGWVNFKIVTLEERIHLHDRFDSVIIEENINIVQELRVNDPEKQRIAVEKLNALNEEIKRHVYDH